VMSQLGGEVSKSESSGTLLPADMLKTLNLTKKVKTSVAESMIQEQAASSKKQVPAKDDWETLTTVEDKETTDHIKVKLRGIKLQLVKSEAELQEISLDTVRFKKHVLVSKQVQAKLRGCFRECDDMVGARKVKLGDAKKVLWHACQAIKESKAHLIEMKEAEAHLC